MNIAKKFISAINQKDIDLLNEIMDDDHVMIDAMGSKIAGKEMVLAVWRDYFSIFPDYEIEVLDIVENSDMVGIFGFASGTFRNKDIFRIPAAYKIISENGKITEWHAYSDTRIPYDIISENL